MEGGERGGKREKREKSRNRREKCLNWSALLLRKMWKMEVVPFLGSPRKKGYWLFETRRNYCRSASFLEKRESG